MDADKAISVPVILWANRSKNIGINAQMRADARLQIKSCSLAAQSQSPL